MCLRSNVFCDGVFGRFDYLTLGWMFEVRLWMCLRSRIFGGGVFRRFDYLTLGWNV
jgi:hypothetical protein